ncbi:MAG TPA: ATP-binding protein [Nanoarchaeota archaeon]|nr:ATP-binding protein [Nanoarchaeota archaeon]
MERNSEGFERETLIGDKMEILSKHTISILGIKGYGKTVASSILTNNINDKVVIVIDTVGAYTRDRLIKKAEYIRIKRIGNRKEVIKKGLISSLKQIREMKVVFDISRLKRQELVIFIDVLAELLLELGEKGNYFVLVIDEIGEYLPQNRIVYSEELERVIRIGRNYNISPVIMITQRPQKVAKDVLALSDTYIIFKTIHQLDREKIKELLGLSKEEFRDIENILKNLKIGESLVITEQLDTFLVRWDMENQDYILQEQEKEFEKKEIEKEKVKVKDKRRLGKKTRDYWLKMLNEVEE